MEDGSQDDDVEKFQLELTPWQMYSLSTILQYNTVNMDDPMYATASQVLAREVHDVTASDDFLDAMESQRDGFDEEEEMHRSPMSDESSFRQTGTFQ